VGELVLSVRGPAGKDLLIVNHYRIIRQQNGSVSMADAVNENPNFVDLRTLVAHYGVLNPKARGGLAATLVSCVSPDVIDS
jgi:hypothetical protein